MLINLLGNALKFTTSGTITLKVEYRFQTAYFEIRDTGCGIAEADLERIFNPFERGSNVVQGGFTEQDSTTNCKIISRFTRRTAICD